MGMFDNLRCEYPLPVQEVQTRIFQTKDTPSQFLDDYKITQDGKLLHEAYDVNLEKNKDSILGVLFRRDNKRWEEVPFKGEIRFYTFFDETNRSGWVEFSAYFTEGRLTQLQIIEVKKG